MSSITFPQISKIQVVLYRCESSTGKVLGSDYKRHGGDKEHFKLRAEKEQPRFWMRKRYWRIMNDIINNISDAEVYSVFDSLDEAINYINIQKVIHTNVDYLVKDHTEKIIYSDPDF